MSLHPKKNKGNFDRQPVGCNVPVAYDAPAPSPEKNMLRIILIGALAVLTAAAVVLIVLIIHNLQKPRTFNYSCAEYTEQINALCGKEILQVEKWVVKDNHAVYDNGDFKIEMDIDPDSNKIKNISITPPENETAVIIIQTTVTIVHTEYTVTETEVIFEPEPEPTPAPTESPSATSGEAPTRPVRHYDRGNVPQWEKRNDNKLYFYADPSVFQTPHYITCYLYEHSGDSLIPWGANKGRMRDEGDNIWSFDLAEKQILNYMFRDGKSYGIIFTDDWGYQTTNLIIGSECVGDLSYMTGEVEENSIDCTRKDHVAEWVNADPQTYGVPLCITSLGNIIGETLFKGETEYSMYCHFLQSEGPDSILNAVKYTGKTKQEIADYTARELGLTEEEKQRAFRETGFRY